MHKLRGLYDPAKTVLEAEHISDDFLEYLRYPLPGQSKQEIFASYKESYGKLAEIPPACCLDAIIWSCENNLYLEEQKEMLEYAFALLFGTKGARDASYSPLAIQYFCEHYFERWTEFAEGKEKLKNNLFLVVSGDPCMEEYVRKL